MIGDSSDNLIPSTFYHVSFALSLALYTLYLTP
jgi:hypothetical protein